MCGNLILLRNRFYGYSFLFFHLHFTICEKENFKESKTVIDLLTLLLYMSDFENYIKDEKTIEKETKISYKKIHFLKSRIPIELKNNTK